MNSNVTLQEQAIEHFGSERQFYKYFEELAECLLAYHRWKYNPCFDTWQALISEIADVEVCIPYPREYFGNTEINKAKAAKLERLRETIKKQP